MLKREFEELIQDHISQERYEVIETVYQFYPEIKDVGGKDQVAWLYMNFGLRVFEDMLPRAKQVVDLEAQIMAKTQELDSLKDEIRQL